MEWNLKHIPKTLLTWTALDYKSDLNQNISQHQDTSGPTSSDWLSIFSRLPMDPRWSQQFLFLTQDGEAVWSSWLKESQSCKHGVWLSSMYFLDSMIKWLAAHLLDISAQKSKASHMCFHDFELFQVSMGQYTPLDFKSCGSCKHSSGISLIVSSKWVKRLPRKSSRHTETPRRGTRIRTSKGNSESSGPKVVSRTFRTGSSKCPPQLSQPIQNLPIQKAVLQCKWQHEKIIIFSEKNMCIFLLHALTLLGNHVQCSWMIPQPWQTTGTSGQNQSLQVGHLDVWGYLASSGRCGNHA